MIGLLGMLWAASLPARLYAPDEADLAAACKDGVSVACGELAWGWAAGAWGEPDLAKAWAAVSGPCEAGSGGECIAALMLVRKHPELDPDELKWTERACDAGLYYPCIDLARRYTAGRAAPADPARARSSWQRACRITNGYSCQMADGTWPASPAPALDPELAGLVEASGLRYEPPSGFVAVKKKRRRDRLPGMWALQSPSGKVQVGYAAIPWSALAGLPDLEPCRRPGGGARALGESAECDRTIEAVLLVMRQNVGFEYSGAMPLRDEPFPLLPSMLEFGSDTAQMAVIQPDPKLFPGYTLGMIYAFYRAGSGLAVVTTLLRDPSALGESMAAMHSLRFDAPVEEAMPRTTLPWHVPIPQE